MTIFLAHPLTEPGGLGLPPVFVAAAVVAAALLAARWVPAAAGTVQDPPTTAAPGGSGHLGGALGAVLLVFVVVAGRLGREGQVDNIASSLAIGVIWPLLLALSLVTDVWDRLNPFDAMARGLAALGGRDRDGDGPASDSPSRAARGDDPATLPGRRWWAVPAAVAWVAYLGVLPDALDPRVVGAVLGGYTILTLAGCLAVGRRRWLDNGEVFTVFFRAVAAARRGDPDHDPPAGTGAVAGILAGGLAFGTLRLSQLWFTQLALAGVDPLAARVTIPGLVVLLALSVAAVRGGERWSQRAGNRPGVVVGAVAVLGAGIGVAQAFIRERFVKAAILVIARASNPLGGDRDWFGTADLLPGNTVIGEDARVAVQLMVLVVTTFMAARVVRRTATSDAHPALVVLGGFAALGVLAVTAI